MLTSLMSLVQSLTARLRDESGQALVEYGLLVGLIAVVCVAAVTAIGLAIAGDLNSIVSAL